MKPHDPLVMRLIERMTNREILPNTPSQHWPSSIASSLFFLLLSFFLSRRASTPKKRSVTTGGDCTRTASMAKETRRPRQGRSFSYVRNTSQPPVFTVYYLPFYFSFLRFSLFAKITVDFSDKKKKYSFRLFSLFLSFTSCVTDEKSSGHTFDFINENEWTRLACQLTLAFRFVWFFFTTGLLRWIPGDYSNLLFLFSVLYIPIFQLG